MPEFGSFSVVLALTFCIYAMFALFYGAKSGRRDLVKSGEHAVYAMFAFVTLAVFALEVLLMRSDFRSSTSRAIPTATSPSSTSWRRCGAARRARSCSGRGF
jgi:cytochrome c biogenesis factor